MKNLHTFEEFLNESSSFNITKGCKFIKFILSSPLMYPNKPFFFAFKKGIDEKEIESLLVGAEKEHKEISKIKRTYGKNHVGETVLQLDKLNYSGLTWIFKALDEFYGNNGASMGWHGSME